MRLGGITFAESFIVSKKPETRVAPEDRIWPFTKKEKTHFPWKRTGDGNAGEIRTRGGHRGLSANHPPQNQQGRNPTKKNVETPPKEGGREGTYSRRAPLTRKREKPSGPPKESGARREKRCLRGGMVNPSWAMRGIHRVTRTSKSPTSNNICQKAGTHGHGYLILLNEKEEVVPSIWGRPRRQLGKKRGPEWGGSKSPRVEGRRPATSATPI